MFFLIGIMGANGLAAQSYQIKSEAQRVNNKKYMGVSSFVDGAYENVEDFWNAYLKDHGKLHRKRNYYEVSELVVKDFASDSITYVTRVKAKDSLGLIWIAPFGQRFEEEDLQNLNDNLEKLLKLATRAYYVNAEQKKLDQSEQAAMVMSKNHQKLLYEGEKLAKDLAASEALKADLEAQLEETILKIKVLNQQIVDNKAATIEAYKDLEKIKSVIEGHKKDIEKIK